MNKKNKKFDMLSMSDMNAVRAGNGLVVGVTTVNPMVKDSSIT